jgi:glycosyltransferase involved in cell wall biosynthesis
MPPKKILIFSIVYYPQYVGGAELAVHEITKRIDGEQVEFHLIALRRSIYDEREERIGNVVVHRIGWPFFADDIVQFHPVIVTMQKFFYPVGAFFCAIQLHRRHCFNALWSLMANYAGFAAVFFKMVYPKMPLILSLQEGDSENHLKYRWGGLIGLSWKLTLKKTNFLAAISQYLLDRARGFGFLGVASVIPNGVNVSQFSNQISDDEKKEVRKKIGLHENDVALITASRLTEKNGIADVITALPLLPDHVKFVIIGVGELESALKNLVKKLSVESRVFFLGFVEHAALIPYLHASDIFIRPSLSEGMGNSFIEAMAARVPVIATPVGGIIDFLIDGKTGYFCAPQDSQSIAAVVMRVMHDEHENEIIENAFHMVAEKYDWNLIAQEMNKNIFEKI